MEGATVGIVIVVAIFIIAIALLDAAAMAWGADSRDCIPDDHRR